MVGHLLQYHSGVNKLKEIGDSGELGDIRYIYGNRLNLGQLLADENALWSLERAMCLRSCILRAKSPTSCPRGASPTCAPVWRTSSSGSCSSSRASRPICICRGSIRTRSGASRWWARSAWRHSTTWTRSKITIDDKGFDESAAVNQDYVARSGDIWSPRVPSAEPLWLECEHFAACVRDGREPVSGDRNGLAVVRVLEGLQSSLDENRRGPAPQAVVSAERAAATTSSA